MAMTFILNRILIHFGFPPITWTDDGWLGKDKIFHFALHFAIVLVGGFALPWLAFGRTHWLLVAFACLVSIAFGFVWEMYDSARGPGASWKDLIWNNLGMILAVIAGVLLLSVIY